MLNSTKIKYFTVVGTLVIISTSYLLHAKTFYTQMYEERQENENSFTNSKTVVVENSSDLVDLKPSKVVEKEVFVPVEKVEFLKKSEETVKPQPIEIVDIKTPAIVSTKPEQIDIVEVKIPTSATKAVVSVDSIDELTKFKQYLYLNEDGDITLKTKKALDDIVPLIKEAKDYYIEVEGYSAFNPSLELSRELSQKYAQVIADYLKSLKIEKKIIVIGHSDSYPIIEDKNDIRNSRVELKFRREID